MSRDLVTLEAIRAAHERLADVAVRTPVEESRAVSRAAGITTSLKCEHLQRTGSFKIRGAYNRIVQLTDRERRAGVVCASAGNHAQGVALSAHLAGVPARVFMPESAPLPKVEATEAYGAEVVLTGATFDDAFAASQAWTREHGATFVHPFDHADVIAGQGTVGLEILEQVPDAGTIVVPIGGGGLISGIATAVTALRPDVRIVGVQAAGAAAFPASIAAGHPVALDGVSTIADGIAVKNPGELTLAHVRAHVDEVVTVTDESIARAVLLLVERAKQVVEPSGAAGLAAVLDGEASFEGRVVVVLCGGNVDPLLLLRIIHSGMFEEGRYFVFRTPLRDEPGALSDLLGLLASLRANVLGVAHHRMATKLGILEVEVELEIETRGPDHIEEVRRALEQQGFPLD